MLERDCQHVTVGVIYSWIADQTRAKVERRRGKDGERHYENNSRPGRVVVLLQFHQKNLFWRIRWAIFVYFKALTSKASWKPQYVPNLSVWQTRRDNGGSSRRRRRRRSSGEKAKRQTNTREGEDRRAGQICDKIVPMRVALDTTEFDVPLWRPGFGWGILQVPISLCIMRIIKHVTNVISEMVNPISITCPFYLTI